MTRRKLTATGPGGQVFTRTTERTYTHVVAVLHEYDDGHQGWTPGQWAGRPDLAQKAAAKAQQVHGRMVGLACGYGWSNQLARYTGHRTLIRATVHTVPVD
jgi:hypothetical protein